MNSGYENLENPFSHSPRQSAIDAQPIVLLWRYCYLIDIEWLILDYRARDNNDVIPSKWFSWDSDITWMLLQLSSLIFMFRASSIAKRDQKWWRYDVRHCKAALLTTGLHWTQRFPITFWLADPLPFKSGIPELSDECEEYFGSQWNSRDWDDSAWMDEIGKSPAIIDKVVCQQESDLSLWITTTIHSVLSLTVSIITLTISVISWAISVISLGMIRLQKATLSRS
jgi:hypothetical protein